MDRPSTELLVLGALADDVETVETMRDHGEVAPFGLALVPVPEILAALRRLLDDRHVAAFREDAERLVPEPHPTTDDESLLGYWFDHTPEGARVWAGASDILEEWYAENPIVSRDGSRISDD